MEYEGKEGMERRQEVLRENEEMELFNGKEELAGRVGWRGGRGRRDI